MMLELHNHARVLKLKAHNLLTIKCTCLDPKDAPSSSSQDSTFLTIKCTFGHGRSRAVRAYSQDAPVLPLKQHLLDPKTHLRAGSLTGLGAAGGNADGLGRFLTPKMHLTGLGRFGHGRFGRDRLRAWALRAGTLPYV